MTSALDDRGRVLLPKEVREELGLGPGSALHVEVTRDGVLLRPALPLEEALRRLIGCINPTTRRPGAEPMDPLELKHMWEPRL